MKKIISYDLYQNNIIIEHRENIIAKITKNNLSYSIDENEYNIKFKPTTFEIKTKDYNFTLIFLKKIAYLTLMEYNVIDLKVLDQNFIKKEDEIIVDYKLESSEEGNTKLHIKIGEDVNER